MLLESTNRNNFSNYMEDSKTTNTLYNIDSNINNCQLLTVQNELCNNFSICSYYFKVYNLMIIII